MPNWTKEQMDAINTTGINIIVSAGAGSGKTAVLTERVLTKIKSGININELLILTFTNAAAHEMKERIGKTLKKEGFLDQLEYIEQAYITTFDSFALSIVKKYHYLLNIPKNINIIDGTFIKEKQEKILDEIFEEYYKIEDEKFLKLIDDFCVKDDKQIRECIITLYEKLKLKENIYDYLDNYFNEFYSDEHINKTFNELESLINTKKELLSKYLDDLKIYAEGVYYAKMIDVINPILECNDFNLMRYAIPTRLPISKELSDEAKDIKSKISNCLKEINLLCDEDKEILIDNYKSTQVYIEVIRDIILKLHNRLKEYKRDINYYEFSDIAIMAIDIIKNNEDIRLEMKNTYKEIMIDEYQDTNDLQEYFISLIENKNVYMVGDIKQSIYRFRNANPLLFKSKYDNYKTMNGGVKIDLNKNFRSRREILDDINVLFELVMDNSIGGAEYRDSHKMIFGNMLYETDGKIEQNNNLEIYNYEYDKNSKLTREEIEAFIVAEDLRKKVNEGYLIFDKDTKVVRPCTYSDFVILMDRTTSFDIFKNVLNYYEIPTLLFKDENIINEDEILLFKNYIKLLLQIHDNIYDQTFRYVFVSVSRSYLYNMSDDEIYNCFNENSFYQTKVFLDAKELAQNIDNLSAVEILINIVNKLDFFHKINKTKNINNKIAMVDYLKKTIKNLNLMGMSLYDICDYLDGIVDGLKEIKVSSKQDSENAVKIMTIFKSKGLEFSICYQCLNLKLFNIRELNGLFFYDEELGIIPSLFQEGIKDTYLKNIAKRNYIKENISERIRLFYVSLTRCKEKMIILADLNKKDTSFVESIVNDDERLLYKSFNDILLSVKSNINKYITNIDLNKINLTLNYKFAKDKTLDKNFNGKKIVVNPIKIEFNEINSSHFSKETHELIDEVTRNKMDYGTYMHELLESIDFKNINIDDIDDTYKNNILSLLNHDVFKNLNDAKIFKEYEFIYNKDNINYHGIIDLMIVHNDHLDIIDYKLKNIDDIKYIEQLNGYKSFIENTFNKKVNLYLYSIMDNELKKI